MSSNQVQEIRRTVRVLPGSRIELSDAGLVEGQDVDVIVRTRNGAGASSDTARPSGVLDVINSLPPGPRSAATWAEVERQYREERDAWD